MNLKPSGVYRETYGKSTKYIFIGYWVAFFYKKYSFIAEKEQQVLEGDDDENIFSLISLSDPHIYASIAP